MKQVNDMWKRVNSHEDAIQACETIFQGKKQNIGKVVIFTKTGKN